jgi:DNA polymerase III epsilon subunit-like protein
MDLVFLALFILIVITFFALLKRSSDKPTESNYEKKADDSFSLTLDGVDVNSRLKELSKLPGDSQCEKGVYLFLDTETTGLPKKRNAEPKDFDNWPYVVEIAWLLTDESGLQVSGGRYIVKQNVKIPQEAINVHHITNEDMNSKGVAPKRVYKEFLEDIANCEYIIGHNLDFDLPIIQCELYRNGFDVSLYEKKHFCTMKAGKDFCYAFDVSGRPKNPKLVELFSSLYFNVSSLPIKGTHSALSDTLMTYRCFMKMIEQKPGLLNTDIQDIPEEVSYSKSSKKNYVTLPHDSEDKLSGDILKKDLSNADPSSIFYDQKVVITGVFPISRYRLAEILKFKMGADIDVGVGKNTRFLLVGDVPGYKKIEKAEELGVDIIEEDEVMNLISEYL